jgi:hypothetical protein
MLKLKPTGHTPINTKAIGNIENLLTRLMVLKIPLQGHGVAYIKHEKVAVILGTSYIIPVN